MFVINKWKSKTFADLQLPRSEEQQNKKGLKN